MKKRHARLLSPYIFVWLQIFFLPVVGLAQTTLSGKIHAVKFLDDGRTEIIVKTDSGESTLIVTEDTVIEAPVPAKQVKSGQWISLRPSSAGGTGRKGFQSPFKGIPPFLRKKMGLPDIPSTPDVPQASSLVPDIPKVPGTPKLFKKDTESEPTEEEKSLYGRVDSSKPLSRSGELVPKPAPALTSPAPAEQPDEKAETRKVLRVESGKNEVKLELESEQGQREEVVMAADKEVIQNLSISDLRKNMTVQLEAAQVREGLMARRITITE